MRKTHESRNAAMWNGASYLLSGFLRRQEMTQFYELADGLRQNDRMTSWGVCKNFYSFAFFLLTTPSVSGIFPGNFVTFSLSFSMSGVPEAVANVRPQNRDKKKNKPKKEPRFHVILWNDDDHTYDYVIIMLHVIFGYSAEKGFQLAREVDKQGRAIVFTSSLEQAEIKRDQILRFGPDPLLAQSKGSIIATLERIAED